MELLFQIFRIKLNWVLINNSSWIEYWVQFVRSEIISVNSELNKGGVRVDQLLLEASLWLANRTIRSIVTNTLKQYTTKQIHENCIVERTIELRPYSEAHMFWCLVTSKLHVTKFNYYLFIPATYHAFRLAFQINGLLVPFAALWLVVQNGVIYFWNRCSLFGTNQNVGVTSHLVFKNVIKVFFYYFVSLQSLFVV